MSVPVPFDRLPPQNLEAEFSVIGSVLLDNGALHDIADMLAPDDFYRDTHQILWAAILRLHQDARPIDGLILADELERAGMFARAGGAETIWDALEKTPSAANAKYHAEIVKQRSISRKIVEVANESLRDAYSNNFTADELLESLQRRAMAIGDSQPASDPVVSREIIDQAMDRFDIKSREGCGGGLMTGFKDIDVKLGGFRSSLYVAAGRPGQGKTAVGLNIAANIAKRSGESVLFFSIEMGREELADRLLSSYAGVNGNNIRIPQFATDIHRARLREAATLTRDFPLWVDDSSTITPTRMASVCRRHKAKHGLALIVVDYIQIVTPDNRKEPRQEQIASISRKLLAIAKDLDVPVLALAQLNRESEKREDKRPRLADLRESGQIEQDAHAVLLLHRPEYYSPNDRPGVAEILIAKNRGGGTGIVELAYEKEFTRFSTLINLPDNEAPRGIDEPF